MSNQELIHELKRLMDAYGFEAVFMEAFKLKTSILKELKGKSIKSRLRLALDKKERIRCWNCGFDNNIINEKCLNCSFPLKKKGVKK